MMKQTKITLTGAVVAATLLVAGTACLYAMRERWMPDLVGQFAKSNQVTLVVGRLLPIVVHGRTVHALGTDTCPGQESPVMRVLFGDTADAGLPQCIVVTPATVKVRVKLLADGALGQAEEWAVKRDDDRVSFTRPDGSPVIVASKQDQV